MDMKQLRPYLECPVWPKEILTNEVYARQHDDTDGGQEGILSVQFSCDGDAWVRIDNSKPLRFRTFVGGGRSLRTRAALLVLAEAIRLDSFGDMI